MILYTDLDREYFHLCTISHERISWCYKSYRSRDVLYCSYTDCGFCFPKLFVLNANAYSVFKGYPGLYVNFKSGTNNRGYLETLQKIEV